MSSTPLLDDRASLMQSECVPLPQTHIRNLISREELLEMGLFGCV